MAINKLKNSAYMEKDWQDEITNKRILQKGHYNMEFDDSSDVTLKAGSSVEVNGDIYSADTDETLASQAPPTVQTLGVYTNLGADFDGTYYVVCHNQPPTYMWYSTNGTSWTAIGVAANQSMNSVRYFPEIGYWYAVGDNAYMYRATNPSGTWTKLATGVTSTDDFVDIGYANGVWIATGEFGRLYRSTNGTSFSITASGLTTENYTRVQESDGTWLVGDGNGYVYRSTNTTSWAKISLITAKDVTGIAKHGSRWVVVSGSFVKYSDNDGLNWSTGTTSPGAPVFLDCSYYNGTTWGVGYDGKTAYTTDGINWFDDTTYAVVDRIYRVYYGVGGFLATGRDGFIVFTPPSISAGSSFIYDGTNWTVQASNYEYDEFKRGFYDENGRVVGYWDGSNVIPVIRKLGKQL